MHKVARWDSMFSQQQNETGTPVLRLPSWWPVNHTEVLLQHQTMRIAAEIERLSFFDSKQAWNLVLIDKSIADISHRLEQAPIIVSIVPCFPADRQGGPSEPLSLLWKLNAHPASFLWIDLGEA
jgi:hypothetical protein